VKLTRGPALALPMQGTPDLRRLVPVTQDRATVGQIYHGIDLPPLEASAAVAQAEIRSEPTAMATKP
jgi:hypothetical protein